MISKIELEYLQEVIEASMEELETLERQTEWFSSDTWVGLDDAQRIIKRELHGET